MVVAAALLLNGAVAAMSAQRFPAGELAATDAARALAGVVPWLPLPLAALASAVLGALAYGNEMRWPGLAASRVRLGRRLGALAAKSVVVGAAALLLAVAALAVNAVVVRFVMPGAVDASSVLASPDFADLTHFPGLAPAPAEGLFAAGGVGRLLPAYLVLAVAGGWAGLLLSALVRSAVAGVLLVCATPALLEPTAGLLLHRTGRNWPVWVRELLPFQYGLSWVREAADRTAAALDTVVVAALLAPAALLVLAVVIAQFRRRAL
ncbi:hypothetical protein KCH_54180 [Kitasatospora cheerisanensis KCTC 2395]|uniref:Uncharacterized protein n=2 Tax=Kitasatospora cheerisanensis TaxID=81942 RepID=A0A066YS58_9ACTN|nr:hypothetical protein KCH_54180 [Kitasatospora cheerisanensis KCTC 2395]